MSRHLLKGIDLCKRDGQLFIRCPINLKEKLSESAIRSARSLASEVSLRLLISLKDYDVISGVIFDDK